MIDNLIELWNERVVTVPQFSNIPMTDRINKFAEPLNEAVTNTIIDALIQKSIPGNLRVSQLGHPIHYIARSYFYGSNVEFEFPALWNFLQGNIAEALILEAARMAGLPIEGNQERIDFCNVPGHIDGLIVGERETTLVEIKSMSSTYFMKFTREPDNERGYLSQVSCYAQGLRDKGHKRVKVAFLCLNKSNGQLASVMWRPLTQYIKDAEYKITTIRNLQNYLDLFSIVPLPDPVPELKYKKPTGKYLPPPAYRNYASLFYPMEDKTYVNINQFRADAHQSVVDQD